MDYALERHLQFQQEIKDERAVQFFKCRDVLNPTQETGKIPNGWTFKLQLEWKQSHDGGEDIIVESSAIAVSRAHREQLRTLYAQDRKAGLSGAVIEEEIDMNLTNAGLVLEGGGLRGVFTSGVLRRLMDEGVWLASVYGVSMGACNGANYVARQPERNRMVNIGFVRDRRYLSWMRLLRGGDLFGMEFIFRVIPRRIIPFDYAVFRYSPVTFWVGLTDCEQGEAVWLEKGGFARTDDSVDDVFRATASLPVISSPVRYEGRMVMDGGIADPIPVRVCMDQGHAKRVIVLTQPDGYVKKAGKSGWACRWRHPELAGMHRLLARRHEVYNQTLAEIRDMEARGEAFVIRPEATMGVGRVCRDPKKLYDLYDHGYFAAQRRMDALRAYLAA